MKNRTKTIIQAALALSTVAVLQCCCCFIPVRMRGELPQFSYWNIQAEQSSVYQAGPWEEPVSQERRSGPDRSVLPAGDTPGETAGDRPAVLVAEAITAGSWIQHSDPR